MNRFNAKGSGFEKNAKAQQDRTTGKVDDSSPSVKDKQKEDDQFKPLERVNKNLNSYYHGSKGPNPFLFLNKKTHEKEEEKKYGSSSEEMAPPAKKTAPKPKQKNTPVKKENNKGEEEERGDAARLRIPDKSLKAAVSVDERIKVKIPVKNSDAEQMKDTYPVDKEVESKILHGTYEDEEVASGSTSSFDSSVIAMSASPHQPEEEDSSDAAIRKATQNLKVVRALVVLGLLTTAIIVSTCVYVFIANAEEDAFRANFDEIASKMVDSFLLDTRFKFGTARTTATTMTGLIETGAMTHLNMTVPSFGEITSAQRLLSFATMVAWSPVLKTKKEREEFEDFAAPTELFSPISFGVPSGANASTTDRSLADGIFRIEEGLGAVTEDSPPPYHPIWLQSVLSDLKSSIMYNQLSEGVRSRALNQMMKSKIPVMSEHFYREGDFYDLYGGRVGEPFVILYYPVLGTDRETVVGSIASEFSIGAYIQSVWPLHSDLVDILLENSCGQTFTYKVVGKEMLLVAEGDAHEEEFSDMMISSTFEDYDAIVRLSSPPTASLILATEPDYCRYRFRVHATSELEAEYKTNSPKIFAAMAAAIFLFTSAFFIAYDCLVVRRQQKVMENARRSNAIVSSLFPKSFMNRLYEENASTTNHNQGSIFGKNDRCLTCSESGSANTRKQTHRTPKTVPRPFTVEDAPLPEVESSEPMADLFPETTVMFLDIAGFTAWSSEREPAQVFTLLETVYQAFDNIAEKLGVFKIETIGDSYVAVTGLPDPCADHAVIMAKFAQACTRRMDKLTRLLEVKLGPSTGDLKARCGLHSGPVTAGILRGQKARFQLFGDTMNTASRMESTGVSERIQASKATADLLIEAGKSHWVSRRSDMVAAKGKGLMQTFWIDPSKRRWSDPSNRRSSNDSSKGSIEFSDAGASDIAWNDGPDLDLVMGTKAAKSMRLVEWNVDVLYQLLQQIVNARQASRSRAIPQGSGHGGGRRGLTRGGSISNLLRGVATCDDEMEILQNGRTILEEVTDVIDMPKFAARAARRLSNDMESCNAPVKLDPAVRVQLKEFVLRLTALYHDVPFHNFEHASHVTMAAAKMLKRMVHPASPIQTGGGGNTGASLDIQPSLRDMHESTYGISTDPLMQFAMIFSALIHDADHTGKSNNDLISMQTPAAVIYKNQSVAEQNSVDVAWTLLMDSDFDDLRACIYTTKAELKRFRQMVVNAVLATDTADRRLQALRKKRWDQAFSAEVGSSPATAMTMTTDSNEKRSHRKATIVLEYVLQASDVAYTMQHWQTYIKWNECLFMEQYVAYIQGTGNGSGTQKQDPAVDWYDRELQFLDQYVLPLTDRLKACGVFGWSSQEFQNWALQNRHAWEQEGREIVQKMHSTAAVKYGTKEKPSRRNSAGSGMRPAVKAHKRHKREL
jgi:class 3 adenylate cyclase